MTLGNHRVNFFLAIVWINLHAFWKKMIAESNVQRKRQLHYDIFRQRGA